MVFGTGKRRVVLIGYFFSPLLRISLASILCPYPDVLTGVRRQRRERLLRVVRVERVTGVTGRRHFVTVRGRHQMMVMMELMVRRVQHVAIVRVRVRLCRVPIDSSDHLWLLRRRRQVRRRRRR